MSDNALTPDDGEASDTSSMVAETGKADVNESNEATNEGESSTAAQPVVTVRPAPRIVKIHHVGELRFIGILDPLDRAVGYYFDNPHEDYQVRNVTADSNLAVRALIFQGERGAGNHVARKLPALYRGEGVREFHFNLPFRVASPAAFRQLRLPLGFRRCFLGLRPKGTVVHKLVRDADCPPRLVKEYNRIFKAWKKENGALPENKCDVALMAWPSMAYCAGGMSVEFIQELETDSLGGTDVAMY
ncbi:hypothetical protein FGADI_12251 [Fusarium gaditjirri]|uniref:Uncharacterized protein n=1 Tax=Fusarium gaditjirri TaxID=282569 RepID=A0A8H4SSM0_9HYPO|nr:hypothetical protein FGADI_12251 [Fusarium gaditjirri]